MGPSQFTAFAVSVVPVLFVFSIGSLEADTNPSTDPVVVSWSDLGPEDTAALSPVELTRDMTLQQKIDFQVVRDFAVKGTTLAVDPTVTSEDATAAQFRLAAAGIDTVALLSEWSNRQTRAFSAQLERKSAKFDGKSVALQGYIVKLFTETGNPDGFLLVPTPGACSHSPVPAYQAVIIRNIAIEPETPNAFDPLAIPVAVWVTGTMNVGMRSGSAFIVDGMSTVTSAYELKDAEFKPNTY